METIVLTFTINLYLVKVETPNATTKPLYIYLTTNKSLSLTTNISSLFRILFLLSESLFLNLSKKKWEEVRCPMFMKLMLKPIGLLFL